MFSPLDIVAILLIGAAAGMFTGLAGASGVVVVVPALTILLKVPVHAAIGISLLIDMVSTLVTSFIYYRHGNLYIKEGLWIAVGAVAGAQAGSLFADMIPSVSMNFLFGIFLIPMGVLFWFRGARRTAGGLQDAAAESQRVPMETVRARLTALGLGVLVGIMCGIFGAGGGVAILLILTFVLHYPLLLAVGTSSFIMLLTAASGVTGYAIHGNLNTQDIFTALIASGGTVLAAELGSRIANRIPAVTLGRTIGALFAALGVIMIVTRSLS